MKKFLIFMAVVVATSIFPLAAYADAYHGRPPAHHDQAWKDHHDRQWKEHEGTWADHDREWREHRGDRHWRKIHAQKWHEWYKWHQDNDSEFHLHISGDDFELDIDR